MISMYDRIIQENTLFEMLNSNAYSDTEKSLRLAVDSITVKLLSIDGETWTKKRLKEIKKHVKDEITKAYGGLFEKLNKEQVEIAKVTVNNILDVYTVPVGVIDEIVSPSRTVQGYEQKDLFQATSENHARQISIIIGAAIAQGKSVEKIAREIKTKNNRLTKAQLKNSIFTSITEARAITRHNSFEKLEKTGIINGYEYVAVLDSGTTEYCRDHDNRKYYKRIEEIKHLINVHFHCRSVFIPFTASSNIKDRASIFGSSPNESYSKWFSRQSDEFQKATLGNKKYLQYKKGVYKIGSLHDVTGRELSLKLIDDTLKNQKII